MGLLSKGQVLPCERENVPGQKNVTQQQLINKAKIYLPPLHINLSLIKQFVKAMNKEEQGFAYLKEKFPCLSETKVKEGIFVNPQMKQLFEDTEFKNKLNATDRGAWNA